MKPAGNGRTKMARRNFYYITNVDSDGKHTWGRTFEKLEAARRYAKRLVRRGECAKTIIHMGIGGIRVAEYS